MGFAIRASKPAAKRWKLADSSGLFKLVTPSGGRLWRFKYRYLGRGNLLVLGKYPEVSLRMARDRRDDARRQLAQGIDSGAIVREIKQSKR